MKSTFKIGVITALISSIFLFGSFTLFSWLKDNKSYAEKSVLFISFIDRAVLPNH